MKTTIHAGFITVLLAVSYSGAADKKPYLTQEIIDSTIQRAVYVLTEGANQAEYDPSAQRDGIEEAKRIARQLKETARGDMNEKYVRWKLSELDAQISLEEKEVAFRKVQKAKTSHKELIEQYKQELAKQRPDFALLNSIHERVLELDKSSAKPMTATLKQRCQQLEKNIPPAIEKLISDGAMAAARSDIEYCLRYREYLNIPASRLERYNDQLEGMTYAKGSVPEVKTLSEKASRFLQKGQLADARKTLDVIRGLPEAEANALSAKLRAQYIILMQKEDSLVRVNIEILNSKGVNAANEYLQKVLYKNNVSVFRIAYVDSMILSVSTPENPKFQKEFEAVTSEPEEGGDAFMEELRVAAQKKAQKKLDSIKAAEEKQKKGRK
jgi:hypothetical protein